MRIFSRIILVNKFEILGLNWNPSEMREFKEYGCLPGDFFIVSPNDAFLLKAVKI